MSDYLHSRLTTLRDLRRVWARALNKDNRSERARIELDLIDREIRVLERHLPPSDADG